MIGLGGLGWLGCAGGPSVSPEDVVVTVPTVRAPIAAPPSFQAPLGQGMPSGKAQHLLCVDGPASTAPGGSGGSEGSARDALLALPPEVAADLVYGACDAGPRVGEWLAWVRSALERDDAGPGVEGLWRALLDRDDAAIGAFVVAQAPAELAVQYALEHDGPWDPRLGRIAAEGQVPMDLALAALAAIDGPEAERELLALHRELPPAWRDEAALSLWGRTTDAAVVRFADVCRRIDDERCERKRISPIEYLPEALAGGADVDRLFVRYPNHRSAVSAAVAACATGAGPSARGCARSLARFDRRRTAALLDETDDPTLRDLRTALATDRDGALAALAAAGIDGVTVPALSDAVTASELLIAAGRAVPRQESFRWPPVYDPVGYELAAVAGLTDLEFDQLEPAIDAPVIPGRTPELTFFAYDHGHRLRALAGDDPGSRPGLTAMVGLVNAALVERGDPGRFMIDVDGAAVFGPPKALAALVADGWIAPAPPREPPPEPPAAAPDIDAAPE
ncbi:MAG: hypothetical protein ABMB14_12280 [Myxococcota bacterium]